MREPDGRTLRERGKRLARDVVLDAAERLLRRGETADFSMRALAEEAGVGFATPFNHFGSKTAIMQALSSRLIATMSRRFADTSPDGDCVRRVLAMGRVSTGLLLEEPIVYRVVIGSLGSPSAAPSAVRTRSEALWAEAVGDGAGLVPELRGLAMATLPGQLALGFRGCLSFWVAGELPDESLRPSFESLASLLLFAFASANDRTRLLEGVEGFGAAGPNGVQGQSPWP